MIFLSVLVRGAALFILPGGAIHGRIMEHRLIRHDPADDGRDPVGP
jgi:hypothetical protein